MRYAIVGNGVAGTTAALTLRQRDPHASITLISGESDYFFSRTALMYAYMDRLNLRDLEPHERHTYDAHRIERRRGWVENLDAERGELRLVGGASLPYDRLLLATGSTPNRIPWPGLDAARSGVTHFVSLQHLEACEQLTPTTRRAIVVGGGLIGVELAECLRHHGVEVEFLVREPWYWPLALNAGEGALIADEIRRHGITLRLSEEVAEVLHDAASGRVSGVRTTGGVEIAGQMLGICIGVRPAVDWLKSAATPPALGRGVQVNPDFRTSLPNVWAAGDCAELLRPGGAPPLVEQIWYSAKRHGELAARSMLGDTIAYEPPLFYNSAKFFEVEYTIVGQTTKLPPDAIEFFHRVEPSARRASLRIVEHRGAVVGFNMLGARWNHRLFEQWILERRSLADVMARLDQAQFDVEFGRLPLAPVRQAYAVWRAARTAA